MEVTLGTTPGTAPTDNAAPRLSGRMSTTQLVLTVLAFSSPLTCLAGYFSLTIMSSGETAPVAFAIVTVTLLIFAVGYMAMTRHMPRPGAFYAYISEGLGRHVGLASAFLATMSYSVIGMGVYCFAGITMTDLLDQYGGLNIPWWIGAAVLWVIVGTLGYFNVDVSAKVLMWVMCVEVAVVMIFNIAVIGRGGDSGLTLAPFNIVEFTSGEMWVGLLFAMLVFIGFEATALYRDEVDDPGRTIPRATYIAIAFIGVLYTITVWLMVIAFGSEAENVARNDTAGMFVQASDRYVGVWFSNIATALVLTAVLAAILSIHNASTRYVFNLSADHALPHNLSIVHGRHRSPYRASMAVSTLTLIGVGTFALAGSDPSVVYAQLAGLGNAGVFILMALVSVAVVVWFRRRGKNTGEAIWSTVVAPVVSAVLMSGLVGFALVNFDLVVGESDANTILLLVLAGSFLAGLLTAAVMKAKRPENFQQLGGTDR